VEIAAQKEPMKVKVAIAQQQQVPYMLVLGDQEAEQHTVSVRERRAGSLGSMSIEEFKLTIKN